MRYAFRLAQSRPRKLLTVVTKSNAQRHAMVMWDEIAVAGGAASSPTCSWDKELVDACTARMVNRPASLDTVVATNLHADILSDLAAALAGSLGIAPTGNIDPERRYPSMFEPIHGSAFDIMGKGLANPIGTFWSCVMLLEHIGEPEAARQLMQAIETVTANPALHTRDLGGKATTEEVTNAVCAAACAKWAAARRLKPACADQLATQGNSSMKISQWIGILCLAAAPAVMAQAARPARHRPAPRRTSCTGRPSRRAASRTCRRGTSRWCSRRSARPSTPSSSTRPAPAAALMWSQMNQLPGDGLNIVGVNLPHIVFQPIEGQVQYKTADITPVFWFHYTPDILVVPEQSPIKTFADFIKAAKADARQDEPGRLGPELGQPRGA